MIVWPSNKKPTYEEYCEVLGYDPDDDRNWGDWHEFTSQWEED